LTFSEFTNMSWAKLLVIAIENVAAINKGLIENFCIIVFSFN